jgi:aconitate decarboxylase
MNIATSARSSVTTELCEKIVSLRESDISDAAFRASRQLVLDGIAVAVAGANIEEAPRLLAEHCLDQGGKPVATALGLKLSLSTIQAALVNGASMHVLDYEPMWLPATHALSPTLGAILPLAETLGSSGRDVVFALIKGIEIQGWLRAGANVASRDLKFHPPGFVGPFGAVVAAAHLLKLNATQLANAMGIAASRCGGLFSNLGTMAKSSHCAYAAALGLESAMLTARGFTGSKTIFDEGPQSYAKAFMPADFNASTLLKFGPPWRVVDPGYAIKIFPAKFSTHYAISAALAARKKVPSPDAIKAIRMLAADVPSSNRPNPQTGLDGKFGLQYTASAALLDGMVGLQSFTDERLRRADMQALLPKISVTLSPTMSSIYTEGRHLILEIDLADGTTIVERCDRPRGSWGTPPITDEEVETKARDSLGTFLPSDKTDACIKLAWRIDSLSGDDVRRLIRLAGGFES